MLGGAEKQAVKGTLRGKMSLFTKDSSPGNTGCPLKVCSSRGFAERWLPVKGTSRDSPPQLSVIFYWFCCCFLFVGDSCQEWDCFGLQFRWSLRKSPESQDRGCFGHFNNPVLLLSLSFSGFPLLAAAGFLSHQTLCGLEGANPQCYATHLVEFFWSVSHRWLGRFYFGCVKSARVVCLCWGGWAAQLVPAGELVWPGVSLSPLPHASFLICRASTVFLSPSVSTGLCLAQRKLNLLFTLTAFAPAKLFHIINGINEFLLLVVSPLSVGWQWSLLFPVTLLRGRNH